MLGQALPTISPAALAVGVGSAALIFLLRRLLPNWPGMLIAVVLASLAAWLFHLPVETIGSHFGQLPDGLPGPRMPTLSASSVLAVLPAALSFTLLGAVESLLSAKVADGMTGRKHRYNMEVVAQGIANVASAIFGGISVTGTIARTATNIRAGGCSPVSGMMHALFVLIFMVVASPLASFIPLSALAGVLVVVCWNMAEKDDFLRPASRLARRQRADGHFRPHADRGPYRRHHRRLRAGGGVRGFRPHPAAARQSLNTLTIKSPCGI